MSGVFSVTQINNYIKTLFTRDYALQRVTVAGEISNLKVHPSGHIYFTLKDEGSSLSCVMFQSARAGLAFRLSDGQQVEVKGQVSVYEKTGSYQLYAKEIRLSGEGILYERFLQLKNELQEMGMFDPMYKKRIPLYVKTIGIVTADSGAAIRDIVNVSKRRNPFVKLILCPAYVQGANAAPSIVKAIRTLDRIHPDVIIVGRGGGSIEDLWAFNEEPVAKAIFDCETPVISAVGHETDFTIADFVADLRAPTPSAAAELANFDYRTFEEQTENYLSQLSRIMNHRAESAKKELAVLESRLQKNSPGNRLLHMRERAGDCGKRMEEILCLRMQKASLLEKNYEDRLERDMNGVLSLAKTRLSVCSRSLETLSPLKKISGGYGYLTKEEIPVKSISDVKEGDCLTIRLRDGKVRSTVTGTEKNGRQNN